MTSSLHQMESLWFYRSGDLPRPWLSFRLAYLMIVEYLDVAESKSGRERYDMGASEIPSFEPSPFLCLLPES